MTAEVSDNTSFCAGVETSMLVGKIDCTVMKKQKKGNLSV
jgi:hypothetical protein